MHIDEAKSFVSLLLHSDYVPLPRRRMYWEIDDDDQNILVKNTMSRNKFDSIMQTYISQITIIVMLATNLLN